MPEITVTEEKVMKVLLKTITHKATAPHGITVRVLNECAHPISSIAHHNLQ